MPGQLAVHMKTIQNTKQLQVSHRSKCKRQKTPPKKKKKIAWEILDTKTQP
jgi:hypothetical protein